MPVAGVDWGFLKRKKQDRARDHPGLRQIKVGVGSGWQKDASIRRSEMQELSPRKVAQVIVMSRELDRAEGEFRDFIEAMTEDEQSELVAVMWIGRGSFEAGDFAEAVETARAEATTPCADYLIGTPHLGENLETGLEALGYSVADEEDGVL